MKFPKAWLEAAVGDQLEMELDAFLPPKESKPEQKQSTELPKWWRALNDEEREEYITEHPNSKYADIHIKDKEKKTETKKPEHKTETKLDLTSPELKPNSVERTKAVDFLKSKLGDIKDHLKHEAKEWHHAGKALVSLSKGVPLTEHDKKAVAAVASDLINVAIKVATGGVLAEGVMAVLHHAGSHLAEEALIKAAVKGTIHKATVQADSKSEEDAILEKALEILLEELKKGDLSKYIKEADKKVHSSSGKVQARIDMSAEVAGRGLCPECKKPMQKVFAGGSPVWACSEDRITLPIPDDKKED